MKFNIGHVLPRTLRVRCRLPGPSGRKARQTARPYIKLGFILGLFVIVGLIYTASIPLFEAPDEPWHFNFVRYVAQGHGLPALGDNTSGAYQEVSQPPLYYLVAGLLTAPVSRSADLRPFMWHNPGFGYQAPGTVNDNKNMLVHTGREGFPWQGGVLAVHLARLVALAFGALAVLATWALAREALPGPWLPLGAAAVVGLTPQFLFISSVTSNDSSAAALSTAALWAIVRLARRCTTRRAILAGVLVGLASLTKTSTILIGLFGLAAIAVSGENVKTRARNLVLFAAFALAVGGWWYARNAYLYGDPLGLNMHLNTPWARPRTLTLVEVLPLLPVVYRSFWGAFGWGNVEMPLAVYAALGVMLMGAFAGGVLAGRTKLSNLYKQGAWREHLPTILCALWLGAVAASLVRWNQQVEAPHGRLLFPAIGALAVLVVGGLAGLPRPRLAVGSALAGLLAIALAVPWLTIRPAYAAPAFISVDQAQQPGPGKSVYDLHYGEQARLLAAWPDRSSVAPGEWLNVTLCWTALQRMERNYTLFVHVLGRDDQVVGERTTYPGLGRFPTSLWPTERAFCDTIPVQVASWTPGPELYAIEAGLYEPSGDRVEAVDASSGQALLPPIVARVRVAPTQPVAVPPPHRLPGNRANSGRADFGPAGLIGVDAPAQAAPGDTVALQFYWQAVRRMDQDYTVFVHLLDGAGRPVAQADSEPRSGSYPTTAWAPGDVVPDIHTLVLPPDLAPGEYRLSVGLYHAPDGPRLRWTQPGSPGAGGDTFEIGRFQVSHVN